jgi:geranylgeranyl diphosphate synthase type II
MPLKTRIETAIATAIATAQGGAAPPRLASALDYAVNPGGARIRPTICMSVAMACGDTNPAMSDAAATAIELIHCASLVHDDMPCFDNADIRRGKPTVHRAYGEPLALLTGDTLIVAAFEVLARAAATIRNAPSPSSASSASRPACPAASAPARAGKAKTRSTSAYHRAKTGALFTAATRMGAAAAGEEPTPGPSLAPGSGRRFRSPTICVTRFMTKKRSASPPIRMRSTVAPTRSRNLASKGAIRRLEDILSGSHRLHPVLSGGGRAL